MNAMFTEIKGRIERIIFCDAENGYTVAKIKVEGGRDIVTAVGDLLSVNQGQMVRLKGTWRNHPTFGQQFKVTSHEPVLLKRVKGIEK
jgi:exodeoxyribonuclease V alpha subunit